MTRKAAQTLLRKAADAIGDHDDDFLDESDPNDTGNHKIALRVSTESGMVWLGMEYETS